MIEYYAGKLLYTGEGLNTTQVNYYILKKNWILSRYYIIYRRRIEYYPDIPVYTGEEWILSRYPLYTGEGLNTIKVSYYKLEKDWILSRSPLIGINRFYTGEGFNTIQVSIIYWRRIQYYPGIYYTLEKDRSE